MTQDTDFDLDIPDGSLILNDQAISALARLLCSVDLPADLPDGVVQINAAELKT